MNLLHKHPSVAWAMVTTTGTLKIRGGYWITIGFPGVSDIIGQLRDGRLFAVEVKQPGEMPTKVQRDFIELVIRNGGSACWVVSVEEVAEFLRQIN